MNNLHDEDNIAECDCEVSCAEERGFLLGGKCEIEKLQRNPLSRVDGKSDVVDGGM